MVRLILTELFKVRKRWMPYILLGIMIALMALAQFGMYAAYRSMESSIEESPMPRAQEQEVIVELRTISTLPQTTEVIFSLTESMGAFLLVVLAGSVIGAEYAWGTVRTNIMRGMGRSNYLLSKLIAILLLTLMGLVIAFIFGFIFAIITTLLEGAMDWGFLGGLYIPRVLAMFGRTWFVLAIPIAMTAMVAILARSSAVAIGVGIAYPIAESIIVSILAAVAGWGETVREYSIGYNMSAVMSFNAIGESYSNVGINFSGSPAETYPAFWRAGVLLAAYGLAFLVVAFYSFRKRDLTS
jgi:ABC-type transport system involved in multi-copper enzyme maturation permease subunit